MPETTGTGATLGNTAAVLSGSLETRVFSPDPYVYRIRDLVYRASGIFHPDHKLYYLEDRCGRRMRVLGVDSPAEYFGCLTAGPGRDAELRHLLNEVAVGETCFFRNQPQLDALRQRVIPLLVEAKSKLGFRRLRIWSAGCSTGEEPYTLAMVLWEELQGLLRGWSVEVLATDLRDSVLAQAQEGVYGDYSLRNVPPYFRQKYFLARGHELQVREEIRTLVSFDRLNLADDSKMVFMKSMDVIFCCNVLIYFGSEAKRRTIQHFYNNLLTDGYLFLGHSESLFGVNNDFRLVQFPGAAAYRKESARQASACGRTTAPRMVFSEEGR